MPQSSKLPPGSLGLPWIGETLQWAGNPFGFMEERFRKHGPVFKTRLFGDPVVCCAGPEAFTKFLDVEHFTRDGATPAHIEELIGRGTLPFVEGPVQQRNKRLLLAAFEPEPMRGYLEAILPVIDRFVAKWEAQRELPLFPDIERMTLSIFDTLFAGADPAAENETLRRDLTVFLRGIIALPLPLPWAAYRKALRARDGILAYLRRVIRERRAAPRRDCISALLAVRDERGEGLADDHIAWEMIHIFFAGYGTMAGNLGYAVLSLGEHRDVRERARAELQRDTSDPPRLEELGRLVYVQAVWKEILRFYPTVPHTFFARVTKPVVVGGFDIPAGWKATGVIHSGMHDERVYSAPKTFDPDRFSPERAEDQKAGPNAHVPQGGGSPGGHRCLGERVSALVLAAFLARVLRAHDWELVGQTEVDSKRFPVAPVGGMPVRFTRLR